MNWYLAKIVYEIICGDGDHLSQFDEQLRIIAAVDEEAAFCKARVVGEAEEEQFFDQSKQLVQWKFVNVSELYPLVELIDGAEVYSRIKEVQDGAAYTTFVNQRAAFISQKSVKPSLI